MAVAPFAGITVLNLATGVAGAVAGHVLALFGARVMLVEPPEGSPLRRVGPFPQDLPDPERSGIFLHLARGQESVTLDRTRAAGRDLIGACARGARLVIEDEGAPDPHGVRAALLERRRTDAEAGYAVLSISQFGLTGPLAGCRTSDFVLFAESGLMASVGEPGQEPLQLPGWLVQAYVGLSAFTAASTALWWQDRDAPHDVDVAALDVLATSIPHAINRYSYTGVVTGRQGNRLPSGYPWTLLPCKDGYIGIIVPERNWDVFCLWMARPELAADPRFATRHARSQHVEELDEIMRGWMLQHTKDELYREGQVRQLPFGGVFTLEDNLARDRENSRAFLEWVSRPGGSPLARATSPFLIDGERLFPGEAPRLGQHTAAVLAERAGIADGPALTHLRQEGLI